MTKLEIGAEADVPLDFELATLRRRKSLENTVEERRRWLVRDVRGADTGRIAARHLGSIGHVANRCESAFVPPRLGIGGDRKRCGPPVPR